MKGHISLLKSLDDAQKDEATRVWRQLALFIVVHMKAGFMNKLKEVGSK